MYDLTMEGMNMTITTAPGKSYREGISLIELATLFPNEQSAIKWFEDVYWPKQRCCGHCGSTQTKEVPNATPMPYWCKDCRNYFSVRTGTTLQNTRLPLRKWAFAAYLYVTNLKGVSSMKLHRDLKVTQKTAWFMLHRLREAWDASGLEQLTGPVEVDETYMGGKRKNMKKSRRKELKGRGPNEMTAVVGMKDRASNKVCAKVVDSTDASTLQGFIAEHANEDAQIYTDDARAYIGLPFDHQSVKHSIGEYVREQVHTNGIESFWAMLKRAHKGTFHKLSEKHLHRYITEFAGRHNIRESDTIDQMQNVVVNMIGKRLTYQVLIA